LGKSEVPFIISIFALIFKFLISYILIKNFGMIGASISSLLAYALTFSIYAFVYFKFIKI
jgi:O-antigen/teichoic acid export membrane protein